MLSLSPLPGSNSVKHHHKSVSGTFKLYSSIQGILSEPSPFSNSASLCLLDRDFKPFFLGGSIEGCAQIRRRELVSLRRIGLLVIYPGEAESGGEPMQSLKERVSYRFWLQIQEWKFFGQGEGILVHPSTSFEQAADGILEAAQKEWESSLCIEFGIRVPRERGESAFVNAGNERHLFCDCR